jgi:hypothetical protein
MPYNPITTLKKVTPKGPGKPVKVLQLSQYEAKQEATRMIQAGLVRKHSKTRALIDVMSSAGILPSEYLQEFMGVNERTLRRYREKSLLERVSVPATLEKLVPPKTHFFYALGVVGIEVAAQIHGMVPLGYTEAVQDKVSHDVLCNMVYYALYRAVQALGYTAVLYSRYEATVHNHNGKPLIEPDAMVVMEHDTKPRQVFLIEYHHEHFSSRVKDKVLKYEAVLQDYPKEWQSKWQSKEPPTMLVVWTHRAVGTGYTLCFDERRQRSTTQSRWLGKPLQSFLDKQTPLLWDNLTTGTPNDGLLKK